LGRREELISLSATTLKGDVRSLMSASRLISNTFYFYFKERNRDVARGRREEEAVRVVSDAQNETSYFERVLWRNSF